ncbi:MAG: hypothetical protein IKD04_07915 [Clostridia bacterium]|nr:hypothetical protein [Clostridia bacterium]
MNFFLLASLILAAVSGLFSLTRQLQMLQQNSYFPSRYSSWLMSNIPTLAVAAYLISSVLFYFELFWLQAAFLAVTAIINIIRAVKIQKKSIKKLVFTGRIKRLFGSAVLIYTALILLFSLLENQMLSKLCAVILFFVALLSPVTTYICWGLTLPIEKLFSRYFINDAKRILKNHSSLKVIGITGSYGKTTTKFILTRILSEKYNVVCTPQSFNTTMGVVRTVREKLQPQTQVFVCEMGAKNLGDIKEICDIVKPDYGLITSVGAQHLETFKSVDNVFKTKFELADAVDKKQGSVFVNGDSAELISRLNDNYTIYGTDTTFKYKAQNISYGRNGSEFEILLGEQSVKLTSRLLGLHSIINITGAAGLAYELGVSAEEIRYAVASLKPTEHRLELKPCIAGSLMIDDAYNANPEGCIEAVRVLGSFEGMQKVIITPGLIELGEREYDCNFRLGLETAAKCDIIIFVGLNRSKPMVDAVNTTEFDKSKMFVAQSFKEAMEIYSRFADSNTVLLIENDLPDNYLN